MNAVLLSIKPKYCKLIIDGKKTIEVRKSYPTQIGTPFKCYIYCTKPSKKYQTICGCTVLNTDELYRLPNGKIKHDCSIELMAYDDEYSKDNFLNGKIIGEFTCDKVNPFTVGSLGCDDIEKSACLSYEEMINYFYKPRTPDGITVKTGYGWYISDLKIYDKPKELDEFGVKRSPQSWQYIEVDE